MEERYDIGFTATYIKDHGFNYISSIPVQAAIVWVQAVCPDAQMHSHAKASDMEYDPDDEFYLGLSNTWLNKLFVVVEHDVNQILAVYNHDNRFYLVKKEIE
jgi:hypothetical protein